MKRSKTFLYIFALILFSYGAIELTVFVEQQPGGVTGAFDAMGGMTIFMLFVLPLLLLVFAVFPPLLYPFVVLAYPLLRVWQTLRGKPGDR